LTTAKAAAAMIIVAALAGCAGYHADPLAESPDLRRDLAGLTIDPNIMSLPELRSHPVDMSRPLDPDAVAMIAVARNPDLRAARAQMQIARAQVFSAGLLPNPQFSADYGLVASGPGTVASFTLGLMQDIAPFITYSSRQDGAEAQMRGTDLAVLWQEWQVVAQARMLTVRRVELGKQHALLDANRQLFERRYHATRSAMLRGDQTLANMVSDLAALNAVESQLHDNEQQVLAARLDLNALLGLAPEAGLALADDITLPPLDPAAITADLPKLVARRPDLLALKAAYEAQEETLFQAVLNQFPPLSIGGNRASDTSNIKTNTASISLSLPLFNHNQGTIAVEKTSRAALKLDYQARLDAAYGGVGQALLVLVQLDEQFRSCSASIEVLAAAAEDADHAYGQGGLDERSFADLHAALLARRGEALRLEQSLLEQRMMLRTLIGSEFTLTASKELQE
jgi:outer membrane protein TolC